MQGDLLLLLEKLDKDLQLQVEAALDEVEEEGRHRLAFQRGSFMGTVVLAVSVLHFLLAHPKEFIM